MKPTKEQLLEKRIARHFYHGIEEFKLIEEGDRILIGLSGGKDSLSLLEWLSRKKKIYSPRFEVEALHVKMSNIAYESDNSYLKEFAESRNVKLHIVETSFDESTDRRKSPCFLCSWNRRKMLFNKAQELGCNKVALGHHQDDILHTSLMNLFYQGQFATMPALIRMKKFPLTIIRPFCEVKEEDLKAWASLNEYQKVKKLCPYEKESNRTDMRNLFEKMEQENPEIRYSMWNALKCAGKLTEE